MFNPESLRKIVCIPAYIIVAICALICSINALSSNPKITMKLFFGDKEETSLRKTIVASILLLASLITLACAVSWMMMK
jgi:hypothetical protein